MAELRDLNTTAGSNTGTSTNGYMNEGINYSEVNNAYREFQAMVARWYADRDGSIDSTGSAGAYVVTANQDLSGGLQRGDRITFEANHSNTGAATLNVDAVGAVAIVTQDGNALDANAIVSGGVYQVIYDGTSWQLVGSALVNDDTWSGTELSIANGGTGATSASAARTGLGVAIGSDVQAHDSGLDAIAGLAVTNSNFIVGNGSTWVAETGATARTSLGLGSLATLSTVNNGNWSGTDLAVVNGGTGSSTAAGARSNLGLGDLAVLDEVQAASTTVAGIIELATDAEAEAGSSTTRAVTPGNFSTKDHTGEEGYALLPGGTLLSWGRETNIASGATGRAVSFARAYSVTPQVTLTLNEAYAGIQGGSDGLSVGGVSTTGFTIYARDAGTRDYMWTALGVD